MTDLNFKQSFVVCPLILGRWAAEHQTITLDTEKE